MKKAPFLAEKKNLKYKSLQGLRKSEQCSQIQPAPRPGSTAEVCQGRDLGFNEVSSMHLSFVEGRARRPLNVSVLEAEVLKGWSPTREWE